MCNSNKLRQHMFTQNDDLPIYTEIVVLVPVTKTSGIPRNAGKQPIVCLLHVTKHKCRNCLKQNTSLMVCCSHYSIHVNYIDKKSYFFCIRRLDRITITGWSEPVTQSNLYV